MFRPLKSKVHKDHGLKQSDTDDSSVKGSESRLNRTQSIESLNSTATSENKLKKKDELIKKWEDKVSKLVSTVRERNERVAELESLIQKERNEFDRKLTEVKESSALDVQSLLDDHRIQIQKLEQDLSKYQKKAQDAETQVQNFRNQCFSEEQDTLNDFSKQELAKVKHMLIMRENEMEKLKIKIDELNISIERLESLNKTLTIDIQKKQAELTKILKDRETDSEERRSQQTTIRGLITDKDNLEQKLEMCNSKLSKTESLLNNVERSSADLHSKHQQLNRDYEQLKNKFSRLEAEKADRESDLKDRIRSLENHLALVRDNEQVDDRVKLLEEKYFQMEAKNIEEKELKDSLVKSWSERVYNLETQISNLNKKIAEDSEEISGYNQVKDSMRQEYEKQIKDFKREITDREKKISMLQDDVHQTNVLLTEERNKWQASEDKLHSDFQAKVHECTKISEENLDIKRELKRLSDKMSGGENELKNKISVLLKVEEDVKKLKMDLEEKSEEITSLMNERFRRELKVTELNSQISSLESTKSELEKVSSQTELEFKSVQKQLKQCLDEKAALVKSMETVNEQNYNLKIECDHRIKTMQSEVESRSREADLLHSTIKEQQEQIRELELEKETVLIGIESSEVLNLKSQMESLNSQLSDKNNIIRIQKQKIGDLKKSLSKEIKLNNNMPKMHCTDSDSLDSRNQFAMNDSLSDSNRLSTNQSFNAIEIGSSSGDDAPVVVDRNGYVIMDQINFKYLKHVIMKFLLSKESEAVQLIKAVSTLLRLTTEEENQIKSMLDYKHSWFSVSKPKIQSKGVQDKLKKSKLSRT